MTTTKYKNNGHYTVWEDGAFLTAAVPTRRGYVAIEIVHDKTWLSIVVGDDVYHKRIDRGYRAKAGITRAVNRWLAELEELGAWYDPTTIS